MTLKYLFCVFSLVVLATGCGGADGPELAEVSGLVTLEGKPAPGVKLVFKPQGVEGGSPSYGTSDSNGRYELMFTKNKYGAMPGEHIVEVSSDKFSQEEIAEMKAQGDEIVESVEIPKKYKAPDAIKKTVEPGDNEINIELTSD